ncbi:hypothetical protein WLQ65_02995 [Pseudoalteromonas piscicida]|uniref:hypothetical protein n=2 Tax=Pseudoalteromonas piscicida TaxID=43662 RepID=UPI000B50BBAD|nr:hypothetical protein [Pseudoalteromonas piscicida]ASD67180.1 hypothetical protein B1L02_09175 [Pseudoalteromonas piscicida]AXQ98175.1 hypothetical protein D0N37_10690 [Pseudoalteromonas piscicida]
MNIKPQFHTNHGSVGAPSSSKEMQDALKALAKDRPDEEVSQLSDVNSEFTIDFSYTESPVSYDRDFMRNFEFRMLGMKSYGIHREHIGTDENGRVYKDTYGDFEGREKIDEFLAIFDRLDEEQQIKFAHFKPTESLLDVANRLTDEELGQLTDFIVQSLKVNSFGQRGEDYSEKLIDKLSSMSDDLLTDTVKTMSSLMEQAENKFFSDPALPAYLLDEDGRADMDLTVREADFFDQFNAYGDMNNQLLNDYAKFIIDNKFSDGDLLDLNAHLANSDFDTSRGMLDMATLVKANDRTTFIEMLNEVDTREPNNLFARLSKLNYENENTEYFRTDNREYVKFKGTPADDNEKSRLYNQLIKAYENQGLGWMNDVMEQSEDMPVRAELNMWLAILEDVEENPDAFKRSDSVESWMEGNLAGIVNDYYQGIKEKVFAHNEELDNFLNMSMLERIELDATELDKQAPLAE